MCAKKGRRGRPRIHESEAARKRAERASAKALGCKIVHVALPEEYKTLLDKFCTENKMSKVDAICYLLDLHYDSLDSTK